jgi:uncharacterized protein (TIGR02646 family)
VRPIRKGPEPASLTTYRLRGDATYEGYPERDKDQLRRALLREQRGICCYCGGKIVAARGGMKIEHWQSQSAYPREQLAYWNLLGACMGGEGQPRESQHCDTYKGDRELSRNPADPAHWPGLAVRFRGDGEIRADFEPLNQELDDVLHLNLAVLKNRRKAVLDGFTSAIRKTGAVAWERRLAEWEEGELRPYSQIVTYWLLKRMARG